MSFDGPIKVELLEGDMLTSRIIMAVDETTHPAASPELCDWKHPNPISNFWHHCD